ncbi:MAG: hypothetical protein A2Z68_02070 [Candidatus Nealsonbacteria bacterium RBG_13_38_11]|uniref:Uncharacterized protein n=1 Tax=Candidatus Nealsonbacteria bacterium RBG_13_38_11 TaxID=1801662 RepID=A0A1G2DZF6_9BACT|nr:MAG: hypothetical protein A2Z68_02070 [Candidatus Nealsonbacteria bacterium RBG_13_38_11]HXK32257.1 hypothetical protein [Candidatus Paceibacterota bacterium]
MEDKPSNKAIFDALCESDSGDPDWATDTLRRADPKDVERIKQAFREGGTESEVASRLGIWPP